MDVLRVVLIFFIFNFFSSLGMSFIFSFLNLPQSGVPFVLASASIALLFTARYERSRKNQ